VPLEIFLEMALAVKCLFMFTLQMIKGDASQLDLRDEVLDERIRKKKKRGKKWDEKRWERNGGTGNC